MADLNVTVAPALTRQALNIGYGPVSSPGVPALERRRISCRLPRGGRTPAGRRLTLTGRAETTPWDSGLSLAVMADNVAVHEEAIVDLLLTDLSA